MAALAAVRVLCGCLLQRDGMAEAFELGDEPLGRAGGVAAAVVVGSEVVVELAVGEHVPDGAASGGAAL